VKANSAATAPRIKAGEHLALRVVIIPEYRLPPLDISVVGIRCSRHD
jgi:hypothetical protein